jgi:hypothetical protein
MSYSKLAYRRRLIDVSRLEEVKEKGAQTCPFHKFKFCFPGLEPGPRNLNLPDQNS